MTANQNTMLDLCEDSNVVTERPIIFYEYINFDINLSGITF